MQVNFKQNRFPKCNQLPIISIPIEAVALDLPAPATREDRVRIRDAKASVEGLKRKISELADQNEVLREFAGGGRKKTIEAPKQPQLCLATAPLLVPQKIEEKKIKKAYFYPFKDKVKTEVKRYRKSYKELSFKSRMERTDEICSHIIAACIDKGEDGDEYYINNEEFANDVLNIVRCIESRLSIKLKFNLSSSYINYP